MIKDELTNISILSSGYSAKLNLQEDQSNLREVLRDELTNRSVRYLRNDENKLTNRSVQFNSGAVVKDELTHRSIHLIQIKE
jgi:hypothetical protein